MAFKRRVWVTANCITYQGASVLVHSLCGPLFGGITLEVNGLAAALIGLSV